MNFFRLSIVLLFSFLIFLSASAQKAEIDTLNYFGKRLRFASTFSEKISANDSLKFFLKDILQKNDFNTSFDSIKTVSIQTSPDKLVRLSTWIIPNPTENRFLFFGFLEWKDEKKNTTQILELIDSTSSIEKPEKAKLTSNNWYGSVCYTILHHKKSKRNYYTILGWKGNNNVTTKKVMDILTISGNKIQFGLPVIKDDKVYKTRKVFEYTAQASMGLRFDEKENMIVFDHLNGPKNSDGMIDPSTMGPDGSYDGFRWKKGKWLLQKDLQVGIKMP